MKMFVNDSYLLWSPFSFAQFLYCMHVTRPNVSKRLKSFMLHEMLGEKM
jgi:hypothetical protein